ncbi:MAG: endolytic transglycosylase MltG [Ideonella sp. MAG2]|nr:MAG: endolytic transglycosylase MltG [Ideonella sp. MAG2]
MKVWRVGLVALLLLAALAGAAAWWLQQALPLASERVEVSIEPGTSPQEVAKLWVQAGVQTSPTVLYAWFRMSGQARRIQAGSYEVEPGVTPRSLLDRMVKGEQSLETVRLIEGWTFAQVREHLAKAPHLKSTISSLDDAQVAALLGIEGERVDGWLFPDTYAYSRGVSDLLVLKRAKAAMGRHLASIWAQRQPDSPLKTPQEMLVLASVVEKETGLAADRGLIAGVFTNRLRIGMPLQSDPTVIYGMGAQFDGNLRRADLSTDHPWNTYTRRGLPPTPIALTGLAALRAVALPQTTRALYFVARGDGSSVFSETLADHNRAVNQFQRGNAP